MEKAGPDLRPRPSGFSALGRPRCGFIETMCGLIMPKIPGIHYLRAVRALQKAGFAIVRDGKKHIVMSDGTRFLTIPRDNPVNVADKYRAYCMGDQIR